MKKYSAFSISAVTLLLSPALALARGGLNVDSVSTINDSKGVLAAMTAITDWIFSGFLMIAVIMILVAAFNFLTAQGDAEKFSTAKKAILYAAVAIAIAVLAQSIVVIAAKLVGGKVEFNP